MMAVWESEMKEFGGYLPLELSSGHEWYRAQKDLDVVRLNSGRTALWLALVSLGVRRVFVPSYYCPSVVTSLEDSGISVERYPVNYDLLPAKSLPVTDSNTAIVLVNYFGLVGERLREAALELDKVIIDNCLAFFSRPLSRDGVVSIYSCRKFFGVPDGAYAIGKNLAKEPLREDHSSPRASHLLTSIEFGTNSSYICSLDNESYLGSHRLNMSPLTAKLMDSIDYEDVRSRRLANYRVLSKRFAEIQRLEAAFNTEDDTPSHYPLYLGEDIREELVSRRVYVPRIWEDWIGSPREERGCLEYQLSNYMVCLPIDQRYQADDMNELADIVFDIVR